MLDNDGFGHGRGFLESREVRQRTANALEHYIAGVREWLDKTKNKHWIVPVGGEK